MGERCIALRLMHPTLLYRYVAAAVFGIVEDANVTAETLAAEEKAIAAGAITAIGRRIVARP